jgi:Domain of unknown function (DUF2382)
VSSPRPCSVCLHCRKQGRGPTGHRRRHGAGLDARDVGAPGERRCVYYPVHAHRAQRGRSRARGWRQRRVGPSPRVGVKGQCANCAAIVRVGVPWGPSMGITALGTVRAQRAGAPQYVPKARSGWSPERQGHDAAAGCTWHRTCHLTPLVSRSEEPVVSKHVRVIGKVRTGKTTETEAHTVRDEVRRRPRHTRSGTRCARKMSR